MPDRDIPDQERAHAILETLAETSPATCAELATALESHPVTVERRCRALQRAGYIRRCAGGTYALTEAYAESSGDSSASSPADATVDGQPSPNPAD